MGFYQLRRQQKLRASPDMIWDFISSPNNLKKITPEYMDFDITSNGLSNKIYEGMIIQYTVKPVLGIKTIWVTEITRVLEGKYFIDEQRVGPFKVWHHQHFIEPANNGTLMTDIVSYQPPMGILGTAANTLFIKNRVDEIFDHRTDVLDRLYNS